MHIEHIAIWTNKLEEMREFYCKYFSGISHKKYTNDKKGFSSYFITFRYSSRLELMSSVNMTENVNSSPARGYAHIAFSLRSRPALDKLTATLEADGHEIVSRQRVTGDGYYESAFLDPDGNYVELCAT